MMWACKHSKNVSWHLLTEMRHRIIKTEQKGNINNSINKVRSQLYEKFKVDWKNGIIVLKWDMKLEMKYWLYKRINHCDMEKMKWSVWNIWRWQAQRIKCDIWINNLSNSGGWKQCTM